MSEDGRLSIKELIGIIIFFIILGSLFAYALTTYVQPSCGFDPHCTYSVHVVATSTQVVTVHPRTIVENITSVVTVTTS